MTSARDMQSARIALHRIPQAAAFAAIGSAISNVLVWLLGSLFGQMTISVPEVVIFSIIGVIGGAGVYAILGKWTRQPLRIFIIISVVVLVLYAFGPIAAAQEPYMQGVERFTTTTVIATELMHLISGAWIIGMFTRQTYSIPI